MKAIISFANERGNYLAALKRLQNSIHKYDDNTFIGLIGEDSIGSPKHIDNPYAFKIYCWRYARSLGFNEILYLDSSVVAVNKLDIVWDIISTQGYIMQEAGHMVGSWCNERTLNYFQTTRDEAMNMPMYGNAGMLGLNFYNEKANQFFQWWEKSMLDGQFIGEWDDHRHDMTCGSIIANKLKMQYSSGNEILHYAPVEQTPISSKIVFHASGL